MEGAWLSNSPLDPSQERLLNERNRPHRRLLIHRPAPTSLAPVSFDPVPGLFQIVQIRVVFRVVLRSFPRPPGAFPTRRGGAVGC